MFFVSPAVPVNVRGLDEAKTKSVPAVAVPLVLAKATLNPPATALLSVTGKLTVWSVPESVIDGAVIDSVAVSVSKFVTVTSAGSKPLYRESLLTAAAVMIV